MSVSLWTLGNQPAVGAAPTRCVQVGDAVVAAAAPIQQARVQSVGQVAAVKPSLGRHAALMRSVAWRFVETVTAARSPPAKTMNANPATIGAGRAASAQRGSRCALASCTAPP